VLYRAFISYSHAADGKLAPALQSALHRFAKPWYRLRAIRVFRDKTSLSLTPALWPSIEKALSDSEYFILMASPDAAASHWVQQEADYWLKHRSIEKFLIVLSDGVLAWDRSTESFNGSETTALPPNLQNAFANEPFYLDLRWARSEDHLSLHNPTFRESIAELAAPLHGRPKDEMIGEDVRQYRRTKQLAWSAILTLLALTVTSVVAAYFAVQQRNTAEQQRKMAENRLQMALARDLAGQATIVQQEAGRLLPRSMLLAVESLRRSPSLQATLVLAAGLRLLSATNRTFTHEKGSNSIDFSPDGAMIASAGEDGTARVWRIDDGRETLRLQHGGRLSQVAFSPTGKYLATAGGFSGTVKVWNATNGSELFSINQKGQVDVLAFSPDDRLLVTASGYSILAVEPAALVWDIGEHKQIARLAHQAGVTAVRFFPDGKRLATASQDGTARVWSVPSGTEQLRLPCEASVHDLAVSGDGARIATSTSNRVEVWNAETGGLVWKSEPQQFDVDVVTFSRNGKLVASGGYDQTARVWDAVSGRELARFQHDMPVFDLTFSADGAYLATASSDGTAHVFALANGTEIDRVSYKMPVFHVRLAPGDRYLATDSQDGTVKVSEPPWKKTGGLSQDGPISMVAFSPSGRYVATASGNAYADKTARLWAVDSRRELARLVHGSGVQWVAFSPDERYLATASEDHTARILDIQSLKELPPLKHGGEVHEIAFGPDGRTLATASFDDMARTFDVATGRELARIQHAQTVWSVAYSSDGRWVASGDANGVVKIWKPDSGNVRASFSAGSEINKVTFSPDARRLAAAGDSAVIWDVDRGVELARVSLPGQDLSRQFLSVLFAPDGLTFATAGLDGHARCWRVSDGKMLADLLHEASVMSIAYSPDGRFLATGSEDKVARIWEVASGREVLRQQFKDWADSVAFSPDGRLFASGSSDHTARIELWRVPDLIEEACGRLRMNLTEEEWREYLPTESYRPTCP